MWRHGIKKKKLVRFMAKGWLVSTFVESITLVDFIANILHVLKQLICHGMKIRVCIFLLQWMWTKNVRQKICEIPNKLYPSFCGFIVNTNDGWFLIFMKDLRFQFFKKNLEWFWLWFQFQNKKIIGNHESSFGLVLEKIFQVPILGLEIRRDLHSSFG
jgi:hypothetical protein